jgi:predicted TIM-barrel fold metal-dependent hydrolase
MHAAGVRGVRIQFGRGSIVPAGEIEPLARHIQPLGWHMQFNMSAEDYAGIAPVLLRLPVPVMIDHFGHVPMPQGTASSHYKLIRRLLDSGNGWMKLSSPYTDSKTGGPAYADIAALARDYIAHAPERMLWASNWPFPDVPGENVDPLAMLNLLQVWAPDARMRHRILVENPEAIYGFDPKERPKSI